MEIKTTFTDKKIWDQFLIDNLTPTPFLQSWDWGEFNEQVLGNKIERWSLYDNNELKMVGMVIEKELPKQKKYWYCPRGVVWAKDYMDKRALGYGEIFKKVKKNFQDKIFLRVLPPYEKQDHLIGFAKRLGLSKPQILLHSEEPKETIVLDLNQGIDDLLKNTKQKTRYNIRLAQKKGVIVRRATKETLSNDLDIFYTLSKTTANRNKIKIYEKSYYEKLLNWFWEKDNTNIKFYVAEKDGSPLAAIIVLYFGTTATYLFGASDDEARNLMPNYLLQWTAITEAKENGMTIYDFWGISEDKQAWSGITKFKRGFGGREIEYLGTWDYVLDKKWYRIFTLLKKIKKLIGK